MIDLWTANIPTESDWNISPKDEDASWAKEELIGLDQSQALRKLMDSGSSYSEWLEFIPKNPFQFYLKVLLQYLLSDASKDDFGTPSSLFSFLPRKIDKCRDCFSGIENKLSIAILEISERQDFYDADIDLFGNFAIKAAAINNLLGETLVKS